MSISDQEKTGCEDVRKKNNLEENSLSTIFVQGQGKLLLLSAGWGFRGSKWGKERNRSGNPRGWPRFNLLRASCLEPSCVH